jgi:DNA-binding CsgD family transcriptional regulator
MTDARRSDAVIRAHVAVSAALAGWESLERDAEGLLCQVATAIQCFRGAMWVPRNNAMVVVAHWEEEGAPEKDRILEVPVRYGKGATGIAWERGEPVCISDVRADPRYDGHEALVEASEIRGLLALPLLAGEEFVALAGFASHHPLDLSGSEYLSLDAFSQTLGRFLATRTAELGKPLLSRRERELLQLAAEGFSGGEIASQLHISRETVKTHFTHIYTKLDVSDRAEAVAVGMRLSLLS